jgi:hypothetical protein
MRDVKLTAKDGYGYVGFVGLTPPTGADGVSLKLATAINVQQWEKGANSPSRSMLRSLACTSPVTPR